MDNTLYILTYDHGGYVLWKDEVKPKLKKISEWMEKYPKLKIGLDYESFTFEEFSKSDPEIVDLCRELLEKYPDRIGLGATTYGQPLSLFISEESNIRQLTHAIRTNLKFFSKTPEVYAISEFALNNQTPQMISLCSYKAAILRSHVMGYGYTKTFDSPWGNWIGKDKTAIPSVPTYDNEGRGFNCTTVDNWILSRWPQDTDISLEDYQKEFSKYSPLLASRYDDLTQPIEDITKHIETNPDFKYILLEDIPGLYGEPKDELLTDDNDFHVQMPWGYCSNEIFCGGREIETAVIEAEKLNALSVMLGFSSKEEKILCAWQNVLINQHHDIMICGLLDLARRFIPEGRKLCREVKEDVLNDIKSVFKNCENSNTAVLNLHSFPINTYVKINGNEFSHVELAAFSGKIAEKENRKYYFSFNKETFVFETELYKIKLTEYGIEFIERKKDKEKLVDNKALSLFTALVENKKCDSVGIWDVTTENNFAHLKYSGKIGTVDFEFSMFFFGNSPRIDCNMKVFLHGERIGSNTETLGRSDSFTVNGHLHEEKLCLNLNLNLKKDRKMFRDLPFSISEWSGDVRKLEDYWYKKEKIIYDEKVSAEESFNSFTHLDGIYWLSLKDSNNGLAVFNKGSMGAVVRGNKISVPLIYSNDYMCGTRILEGEFSQEFALFPFKSDLSEVEIHKQAICYNYPPTLFSANGNLPDELESFAKFNSRENTVIMSAFYPENDNLIARFCNFSDSPDMAIFKLLNGKVYEECNLLGEKIKDVENGQLNFRPWEIKTVKIKL